MHKRLASARLQEMVWGRVSPAGTALYADLDELHDMVSAYATFLATTCRWAPSLVLAPPTTKAVITPMSSLSLVAARDPDVLEELGLTAQEAVGSRAVLSYVFKKYGYDETAMGMDLLTFEGATIGRPVFTAFYGTNVQLSGLFSVLSSTLAPLLGLPAVSRRLLGTSDLQKALMQELSTKIYENLQVNPTTSYFQTGNAAAITSILNETYTNIATQFSGVPVVGAAKLSELYNGVAKVGARQK
jgi:hypothetical protein